MEDVRIEDFEWTLTSSVWFLRSVAFGVFFLSPMVTAMTLDYCSERF